MPPDATPDATAPAATARPAPARPRRRPPGLSIDAWRQFLQVARPYWAGHQKRAAWGLLGLLILLMLAETQFAVMLNNQTGEMTSALAAQSGDRFWASVRACLGILAFAVPIYAFYYYMRDAFANHWRRWLTGRFLDGYLGQRRYYALGAEGEIDNPDQRISEDINTFTGRSTHFLLIFVGSLMQLVAFSAVLWSISRMLVAFLVVYAVTGTVIALMVFGAPLIRLNFWQLRREADFRFGLMRVRENAESIAFYRGEAQERALIERRFGEVYDNYKLLIRKQRSLNMFQRGFNQLTLVVPAVILAGIDRLHALSQAVLRPRPAAGTPGPLIERREGACLALQGLTLCTPQGERVLIKGLDLALQPGHGLLITGVSGCGKSSLLRAIAGLWCSGSGVVQLPAGQDMFFLPQRPYLQPGTLRSQLIYPATGTALPDARLLEILAEVQLGELAGRVGGLEAEQDWEKLLSVGEQQRLAFARVLVREPQVVILDEATSALDSANEARLYQRLHDQGVTLISIAHRPAVLRYHQQVLLLTGDGGWALHPAAGYHFE